MKLRIRKEKISNNNYKFVIEQYNGFVFFSSIIKLILTGRCHGVFEWKEIESFHSLSNAEKYCEDIMKAQAMKKSYKPKTIKQYKC